MQTQSGPAPVWIDASHPVSPKTAVWPGDQPFSCKWTMAIAEGASVNVSEIDLSTHTGTHVDAYLHVDDHGWDAARMPLDLYAGKATVIEVPGAPRAVLPEHFEDVDLRRAERILFKTRPRTDPTHFDEGFTSIHPDAARELVRHGIRLVGSDAPSMDAFDSKTLESHKILAAGGAGILENVRLEDAAPGTYEMFAFPLRLVDLDGSPVRAVLRRL